MSQNNHRILLFDIDGTLLDPANEGQVCLGRALEDTFGFTGPIDTYDMAGKTDWQIVTELMTLAGLTPEEIEAQREEAFAAYARHVALATPGFDMQLMPGVKALLERLVSDPTFILGLVTGNVREAVPAKLRAVGINPADFSFGAFGSEGPDRNVLPALALHRLSQILGYRINPARVLVIGDTPRDVACARHAGLKVLCVATGWHDQETLKTSEPDYLLPDLSDTHEVLEILNHY